MILPRNSTFGPPWFPFLSALFPAAGWMLLKFSVPIRSPLILMFNEINGCLKIAYKRFYYLEIKFTAYLACCWRLQLKFFGPLWPFEFFRRQNSFFTDWCWWNFGRDDKNLLDASRRLEFSLPEKWWEEKSDPSPEVSRFRRPQSKFRSFRKRGISNCDKIVKWKVTYKSEISHKKHSQVLALTIPIEIHPKT